jgi:bifunctional non-homologous end joining protein LigD
MLAEIRDEPFSDPEFLFELKYDGYRVLAARRQGEGLLLFRRGAEATAVFPELARAMTALPFDDVVLDGEVVVLEEDGRPSFQRLQQRGLLRRPLDIAQASASLPVSYYAFDLLGVEGHDLRPLPLLERKGLLRKVVPAEGRIRFSDHVPERGLDLFEHVRRLGLEGIVAKRAASPYQAGRSREWQKIRLDRTEDFVIVGLIARRGGGSGFGALHLALSDGTDLVYAGRVGSGFSEADVDEIQELLAGHHRGTPPCRLAPKDPECEWVEPRLLCEVRYKERTQEAQLRHPVFLRLREDKPLSDALPPSRPASPPERPGLKAPAAEVRRVPVPDLARVLFPNAGLTRGDVLEYYRLVSSTLLPYLEDRPLEATLFPEGIEGRPVVPDHPPLPAAGGVRTVRGWSERARRDVEHWVVDRPEALLDLVRIGAIPLYAWSSRVGALGSPDWSILDLDANGARFGEVVAVAQAIRTLCDGIGLPTFAKTTGSTGLHVLVPLGGELTYDESKALAELISRVVVRDLAEVATSSRTSASRTGRVYVGYLQNAPGGLFPAPLSVLPLLGAPVSTPLEWGEVKPSLDPRSLTVTTVPGRLGRLRKDPWASVLGTTPDLGHALARLAAKLGEAG